MRITEAPVYRVPRPARNTLGQIDRLETTAAREQVRFLRELRRAVVGMLAGLDPARFRTAQLSALLTIIDSEIEVRRIAAMGAIQGPVETAGALGAELVDRVLVGVGGAQVGQAGLLGFSSELIAGSIQVTTGQVTAVWGELGAKLRNTIRRTSLGAVDSTAAVNAITRAIRDPKTFGSAMARAETIVRTEVNRTFGQATFERMRQGNERIRGGMLKAWLTAGDKRVRRSHIIAGDRYGFGGSRPGPIAMEKPFEVGRARLMMPLDPRGPAEETINCFLPGTRVGGAVLAASEAFYAGTAWRIKTARGHTLAVTANHPVLTGRGWTPACEIREGDELLSDPGHVELGVQRHIDHEHPEATVDQVFETLAANGRVRLPVVRGLDLHGDAAALPNPYVDVVAVDRHVLDGLVAGLAEGLDQLALVEDVAVVGAPLAGQGAALEFGGACLAAADRGMSGRDLPTPGSGPHPLPLQPLLLGLAAQGNAAALQRAADRVSGDPVAFRELKNGLAGLVAPDHVVEVLSYRYAGPVFDVQTVGGVVHSNGIISHNCRCRLVPVPASAVATAAAA